MKADSRFTVMPANFWSYVRLISQDVGYSGRGVVTVPTAGQSISALMERGLQSCEIHDGQTLTAFGSTLMDYFQYRADVLNDYVKPRLRDAEDARRSFDELYSTLDPDCPIPMNKQKGAMRAPAYLTGIVNMLMEEAVDGSPCDYDPRELIVATQAGLPLRTLSRRVDGAFPSAIDPLAVWEIKEYYYTTTFGSRVADGVYESLLDGMEIEDLETASGKRIEHVLIVDSRFTWWECGKSYLCRLIDMLNMRYVDHILFGREVEETLPGLARGWRSQYEEGHRRLLLAAEEPSGYAGSVTTHAPHTRPEGQVTPLE